MAVCFLFAASLPSAAQPRTGGEESGKKQRDGDGDGEGAGGWERHIGLTWRGEQPAACERMAVEAAGEDDRSGRMIEDEKEPLDPPRPEE
ncbi:hypothetical protein MUK42_00346 [Musa troglodytarum]|uniref:Secreted protein n=1 Tax=Musa troglodytarum TaxID=320322 RepID=A0A9E7JTI3_9LILI|nr:hypothetical protein MUK42_00346 [Musa troglodytarum]